MVLFKHVKHELTFVSGPDVKITEAAQTANPATHAVFAVGSKVIHSLLSQSTEVS